MLKVRSVAVDVRQLGDVEVGCWVECIGVAGDGQAGEEPDLLSQPAPGQQYVRTVLGFEGDLQGEVYGITPLWDAKELGGGLRLRDLDPRDLVRGGVAIDVVQARQVGLKVLQGVFFRSGLGAGIDFVAPGDRVLHPNPGHV